MDSTVIFALSLVFPLCLLIAAVTDIARYEISNWLVIVLAGAFLPIAILADITWVDIAFRYLAGVLALTVAFVLFSLKMLGGGDGKLLAAAAIWVGHQQILGFLFYTAIFGGILAAAILVFRKTVPAEKLPNWLFLHRMHGQEQGIPYAVAMGMSGLILFFYLPGLTQ